MENLVEYLCMLTLRQEWLDSGNVLLPVKIYRKLYEIIFKLDSGDIYHSKWLKCVKDLLFECGFGDAWNIQYVDLKCNLSKNVKQFYHIICL